MQHKTLASLLCALSLPLTPSLSPRAAQVIWGTILPTRNWKLEPDKAIGLGWSYPQVEDLLRSFVDLDGDCTALVSDLRAAELLTPDLVNLHVGLLSACVEVCPDWLVREMLEGRIGFPGAGPTDKPAQPQASLVLRLAKAFAETLSRGPCGPDGLTDQHAKHLKQFVRDTVALCAEKTIAMYQAQACLVDLVLCLSPKQGRASHLRLLSSFYIGSSDAPGWLRDLRFSFGQVGSSSEPYPADASVSRRALVPISEDERGAPNHHVCAEREVDSFASFLTLILSHRCPVCVYVCVYVCVCVLSVCVCARARACESVCVCE